MNNRKYEINKDFFDNINSEEKAYSLGWAITDRYLDRKYYYVLEIQLSDKYILEKMAGFIYKGECSKIAEHAKRNSCTMIISSKDIVSSLRNIGIIEQKKYSQNFPKNIEKCSMRHFIRGVLDGDGSIIKYKNRYQIMFLGRENFLLKIEEILMEELGVLKKKLIHVRKEGYLYRLSYTSYVEMEKVCRYMYDESSIFLFRKKNIYDQMIDSIKRGEHTGRTLKKSLYIGVSFDKSRNKWISYYGKNKFGRFDTEQEAYERRLLWEKDLQQFKK